MYQFDFNNKYKRSLLTIAVIGVVLLFGGFALTNVGGGHGGHGTEHHDDHGKGGHGKDGHHDGGSHDKGGSHDGGSHDGGSHDGGSHDGGSHDGGSHDGGSHDGGDHNGGSHDGDHDGGDHEDGGHSSISKGSTIFHFASDVKTDPAKDKEVEDARKGVKAIPENLATHPKFRDRFESQKVEEDSTEEAYVPILRATFWPGQETLPHHEHHEPNALAKFGSSLLAGSFWWIAVALFGIFFIAVSSVANAGWYITIKRVLESFYRFLPIGGVLMLILFFVFLPDVYHGWASEASESDPLVDKKRAFLNPGFFIVTIIAFVSLWTFFGHIIRRNSIKEDEEGGLVWYKRNLTISALFLPIFAFSFCICAFLWLMSLEPHWFSTIYGVYCFAGLFVSGATITTLIVVNLKENGYLPEVNGEHLHDLGKFMFAFSIFWGYIWVSQFLLIWYANIPEETAYYFLRFKEYKLLFFVNLFMNFALPFLAFMTRDSKRQLRSLKQIGGFMLVGRFLDIFLLVMPGVLGADWNLGSLVMTAGMWLLIGAGFLYAVFSGLGKSSLAATNHPYWKESVTHDTGV